MIVDSLLVLALLGTWIGALGLLRLPHAMDRLHLVAFVNITTGVAVAIAAAVAEGASTRTLKIVAIVAINLLAGAASSHAIGRALLARGER